MPARKKQVGNLKVVDGETAEPETEVIEKPVRRTFTRAYKAKVLREVDAAPPGTIGSILRREGLYSSHLAKWRAERDERGLSSKKRGPKKNPLSGEVKKLRQENKRLEKRLLQANEIIDLQKKISKILGITLESGESE
jgi:transposase-like protein